MASIEEKISKLQEKLKKLEAQKRAQEARKKAKETKVERAKDTRKKILVGGTVLAMVKRGELPEPQVKEWLAKNLTRSDDRALFELPPLPASPATDAPPVSAAKPAKAPTPPEPKKADQEPPKEAPKAEPSKDSPPKAKGSDPYAGMDPETRRILQRHDRLTAKKAAPSEGSDI